MPYDTDALKAELAGYEARGLTDRAAQVRAILVDLGALEAAVPAVPENAAMPKAARKARG